MKITILSGVCLKPGLDAYKDEHHEVLDHQGRALISRGKAKLFVEAEAQKETTPDSKKPGDK